jgi:hypothetical protein
MEKKGNKMLKKKIKRKKQIKKIIIKTIKRIRIIFDIKTKQNQIKRDVTSSFFKKKIPKQIKTGKKKKSIIKRQNK